jgi:hypothetical protein
MRVTLRQPRDRGADLGRDRRIRATYITYARPMRTRVIGAATRRDRSPAALVRSVALARGPRLIG